MLSGTGYMYGYLTALWKLLARLGSLAAVETQTGGNNLEGKIGENERLGIGFAVASRQNWNAPPPNP